MAGEDAKDTNESGVESEEEHLVAHDERVAERAGRRRLWIIWGAILAVVLCGLFPPWLFPPTYAGGGDGGEFHRYQLLFSATAQHIDGARLAIEWLLIVVVASGLLYTLERRGQKH